MIALDPHAVHLASECCAACVHVPSPPSPDEPWRTAACLSCIADALADDRRARAKRG